MKEQLAERDWLCSLVVMKGLGRKRIIRLFERYGSFSAIGELHTEQLVQEGELPLSLATVLAERLHPAQVEADKSELQQAGIQYFCFLDAHYPEALKEIPDPPLLLFYKGDVTLVQKSSVAVVGARKPTPYGRAACQFLTDQLSNMGFVIVSGLALGIDAIAHQSAIRAGGDTIAVLGCGIDIVYPRSNAALFSQIRQHGLLLSEHPPGTNPLPGLFPERNRIISGLALGTLVVEAAEKSGSLITADCALEQGRDVFAVPGPIFSEMSAGPHNLLKQGAKLVTNAADIVEEWTHQLTNVLQPSTLRIKAMPTEIEKEVLSFLSYDPIHWNQLAELVSTQTRRMLDKHLLTLETKSLIRSLPGGFYVKN